MAAGDLSGPLDSDEWYTTDVLCLSFRHVADTCYAVAFEDVDNDGHVISKFILADGTISNGYEDILEFDPLNCHDPDLIHISGDVFAVVYQGAAYDGYCCTFSIDAAGTISNAIIAVFEFDVGNTYHPRIRHVHGDVYAIFYQGAASNGAIATVTIEADGTIGGSTIATANFIATEGVEPEPIQVAPNVFLTHYRNNAFDPFMVTSVIANNGTITTPSLDTLAVDFGHCSYGHIAHVTGDIYALVRVGPDTDAFINTFEVQQDGTIGADYIAEFEFNTSICGLPKILSIGGGIVLVVNGTGAAMNSLVSIQISDVGAITDPVLDTMNVDPGQLGYNNILHIAGNTYAVAYAGIAGDGFMATLTCVTPSAGPGGYLPMMGVG